MVDEELLLAISNVMDAKLEVVRSEIQGVKADVQKIKLYQENVIMPRLQNIEEAYLSTFERYRDTTASMEGTSVDVGLLKKVVQKHSLELNELQEKVGELQKLA